MLCLLQAATLVDGGTRLAELGVRQGDLLFVQDSADVPGASGIPAARDTEGGVMALPDHLRRVLAEAGAVTCPHYALLLAAHAALLESGLEPAWPVQTFAMPASLSGPSWASPSTVWHENSACQQSSKGRAHAATRLEQADSSIDALSVPCYRQIYRWPPPAGASVATTPRHQREWSRRALNLAYLAAFG